MKVGISEKFTTPSWLQSPNRNGATNVTVTVASGLKIVVYFNCIEVEAERFSIGQYS